MSIAVPDKKTILRVHDTTLPFLSFVEKIILDELLRLGKAEIISELPGQPDEPRRKHGKHTISQ